MFMHWIRYIWSWCSPAFSTCRNPANRWRSTFHRIIWMNRTLGKKRDLGNQSDSPNFRITYSGYSTYCDAYPRKSVWIKLSWLSNKQSTWVLIIRWVQIPQGFGSPKIPKASEPASGLSRDLELVVFQSHQLKNGGLKKWRESAAWPPEP